MAEIHAIIPNSENVDLIISNALPNTILSMIDKMMLTLITASLDSGIPIKKEMKPPKKLPINVTIIKIDAQLPALP
jgi:hypothetical protein